MGDFPSLPRQHRDTVHRRRDGFEGTCRPEAEPRRITVRFSPDLNRFVNSVARALRTLIKFRSDDGAVARGLVLDSDPQGSLYSVHWALSHSRDAFGKEHYFPGEAIWLWARLHRRVSDVPSERWVSHIQFARHATFKDFEGDEVRPSETPAERAEKILRSAASAAGGLGGDAGQRARAYIALAEKEGYPELLDLWHYNGRAVKTFAWASASEQRRMIQRGGGFPLRGTLAGSWQGGPPDWRLFPFRDLLRKYYGKPVERWWFEELDKEIRRSIQELVSAPGGKGAGGEAATSAHVLSFRRHVKVLAQTSGNLYYESDRNTRDGRGIFEW